MTKEQLCSSRRGQENLPRDVARYLVRILTRKTMPEIGKHFDINNYSTVGSVVERMKQHEAKDCDFQKILQKIKGKLAKSQKTICPFPSYKFNHDK